jgi:lysozyme family protein
MQYETKWPEYSRQWNAMVINPERRAELTRLAQFAIGHKQIYQEVEKVTGVPWYLVAVIHRRESDADFSTYLGNGEPLNRVTRMVPRGRGPFASFADGAIDALRLDGFMSVKDWRLEKILYFCELFNGAGYSNRVLPSPYIWGGTNQQRPGKYVADGQFSASTWDTQPGCAPILAEIARLDPTIKFVRETPDSAAVTERTPPEELEGQGSSDLATRIVATMRKRGYAVAVGSGLTNIVYVEGMDADGTPNQNRPNAFDDLRLVIRVLPDGTAAILGKWDATTEPGRFWTENRMNAGGAFHIVLGQQSCWQMGTYHDAPALVQVRPIRGTRDDNEDMSRERDGEYPPGLYGVHHHGGYNYPHDDLGRSSAGCLVGRTVQGHQEFIDILTTDARYKADHDFIWTATVMPAAWLTETAVMQPRSPPLPDIHPTPQPAPQPASQPAFWRALFYSLLSLLMKGRT